MATMNTCTLPTTVVTETINPVLVTYSDHMNRLRIEDPMTGTVEILTDGKVYGVMAQAPTGHVIFDDDETAFPNLPNTLERAGYVEITKRCVDTFSKPHTVYTLRVLMAPIDDD